MFSMHYVGLSGKPCLCCYDACLCPHAKAKPSIDRTNRDNEKKSRRDKSEREMKDNAFALTLM